MYYLKFTASILMLTLLLCAPLFADSLGLTYSESPGDIAVGVYGDYETQIHKYVKFGTEGQFQKGDNYLGNLDVAFTFGREGLGIRVETNNKYIGENLDGIGRTNEIGVGLVFPVKSLEFTGSIFGKTGNPFQRTYRLADATDPNSVEVDDAGIPIKDEATLNLALKTEFDWKTIEASLRGLFEVFGEGDKYHQLDLGLETGWDLTDKLRLSVQGKLTGLLIDKDEGSEIFTERIISGGITYSF